MAVKKFHPRHKGKINGLIKKEIIHMIKLERERTVIKLLHVHIGEMLQLLVYEYMENESLETALFGKLYSILHFEHCLLVRQTSNYYFVNHYFLKELY